jgi:hypothetical protein
MKSVELISCDVMVVPLEAIYIYIYIYIYRHTHTHISLRTGTAMFVEMDNFQYSTLLTPEN